jgi:nucleotide-binding universal stress UspA family protein
MTQEPETNGRPGHAARRVLVAVDDSLASLSAARTAVTLARLLGARLRAVHVTTDGVITAALAAASSRPDTFRRRRAAGVSVLRHVAEFGAQVGVEVETGCDDGEIAGCVLDEAERWQADLIVIGRGSHHDVGQPYIGSAAQRIIEFSRRPVLVVPEDGKLASAPPVQSPPASP